MMKKVIDDLIAAAPEENKGAAQMQVQVGSMTYAGAIKASEKYEGMYELVTIGQMPTGQGMAKPFSVRVYLRPEAINAVFVPMESKSELVVPKKGNGIILPGAH